MNKGISRFRKGIVGTIVGATAAAGLIPLAATGAGATANFDCTRLAGADRYGTAVEISKATFPSGSDTVLLATGEKFPDALAGNYLAGLRGAPILLTRQASLPAETKAEITRLDAENVIILGQTDAVSAAVATEVDAMTDVAVQRVGGADRYETAKLIATTSGTVGTVDNLKTAIVARGDNFPDALAGGPLAYSAKLPILLTNGAPSQTLNPHAKSGLQTLAIEQALILGGQAAITAQVETEIKASRTPNIATVRLEGGDRTLTAQAIANYAVSKLGFSTSHVNLARGDEFPDALAGGPHGGTEKAVILLTESVNVLGAGATAFATAHKATLSTCHIFGGVAAVSSAVETQFETAAGKGTATGGTSVTSRPELQSAQIVSTGATSGTLIRYCFDEVVGSPTAARFHAYAGSGVGTGPDDNGDTAVVSSTDAKCVDVTFAGITTTAGAASLTVATVDETAVNGASGSPADDNPEGDASLGATASTTFSPGITSAPDLQTVGGFTQASGTTTTVSFTFDEIAYLTTPTVAGFHLVTTGGTDVQCVYESGAGTITLVVSCPNGGVALTEANVARGYVDQGTVTDSPSGTGGNTNPLQADDVAGTSVEPDLVSVELQPNVTSSVTAAAIDRIVYCFDEALAAVTVANFGFYNANGVQTLGSGTTPTLNSGPTPPASTCVSVDFADASLANAVGGIVEDGAVTALDNNAANDEDEEGMANAGQATTTTGRTDGPDLTGVVLTAVKDAFNTVTDVNATYAFDEDVEGAVPANFKLWLADGTELDCNAATVGTTEDTDHTVTCTDIELAGGNTDASVAVASAAVLGTVDNGAVNEQGAGTLTNPEGAEPTTKSGF